jgi:hypothetical protein
VPDAPSLEGSFRRRSSRDATGQEMAVQVPPPCSARRSVAPAPDWTPTPLTPTAERDRLSRRPNPSPPCPSLSAIAMPCLPIRRKAWPDHPLAGCRQTRRAVGDIRPLTTCHPLRSAGVTPLPRYYGVIRLLPRHQSLVVAFSRLTADADLKRSPGVRLSNFSPPPPSLLPGHGRISGVVLAGTLAQARKPS